MKCEYEISYLTCQSCTAKIHCEKCAAELKERLEKRTGIDAVEIDIPNRRLAASVNGLSELDFLDILEEVSVFAD